MAKVKRWGTKCKYERDWKAYNEQLIKRGEYYINPGITGNNARIVQVW